MGSLFMSLLGGIAEHYAKGDPPNGGSPAGAGWYLEQKIFNKGDDHRYAPKIIYKYVERPYEEWPGTTGR